MHIHFFFFFFFTKDVQTEWLPHEFASKVAVLSSGYCGKNDINIEIKGSVGPIFRL